MNHEPIGDRRAADIVVAGGGLGGLTAAALLARAGRRVMLFEKSKRLGGRGGSREEQGFALDLGPHAFYLGGAARQVFQSLGIRPDGVDPVAVTEQCLQLDGKLHALPNGFGALLRTSALPVGAKFEVARLLTRVPRLDTHAVDRLTLAQWLDREVRSDVTRRFLEALFRVTQYAHAPDVISAGAALRQLQTALRGVRYLHGGWEQLVNAVRTAALDAGVQLQLSAKVSALTGGASVDGVVLDDGRRLPASGVLIAATPDVALAITGDETLRAQVATLRRSRVAALSLGLDVPYRGAPFILGADAPVYLSAQSLVARMAPSTGALVHVARYLHPDESPDAASVEAELEALMDLGWGGTGWRTHVALRQYLPNVTVTHGLAPAAIGGEAGRPGVTVARAGVALCGDWVGDEGSLLNASLASARAAVDVLLEATWLRRSA